jgi:hypothetical protein
MGFGPKTRWRRGACVAVVAVVTAGAVGNRLAHGQQTGVQPDFLYDTQVQYNRGRHVAPIYEGWFRNVDGTIDMWFGYLNLNWEEVLHIPVGPENSVEPWGADRGQPAVFVARRRVGSAVQRRESLVFPVRLPADADQGYEVVWTLTAHGTTDRAVGLLLPIYELSHLAEGNRLPAVRVDSEPRRVTFPDGLTLSAFFSDDGKPENRRDRASVAWHHYRGPGRVTFEPERSPVPGDIETVVDVEVATTVTFSQPGTFVLRVRASDGTTNGGGPGTTQALVTVEVEPGPAGR